MNQPIIDSPQMILYGQTGQRDPGTNCMILRALALVEELRPGTPEAEWMPKICADLEECPASRLLWMMQVLAFSLTQPEGRHLDQAYSDRHRCEQCSQAIPQNDHYVRIGEYKEVHHDLCLDCGLPDPADAERIRNPDLAELRAWLLQGLKAVGGMSAA